MSPASTIVWFRHDLRLRDNPALQAAVERGAPVIPVFIWSPEEEGAWAPGSASRWWLHQSLKHLSQELKRMGSEIVIRRGPTETALRGLIQESEAESVFWNRRYEPCLVARDQKIKEGLIGGSLEAKSFNAALLFEPWEIKNKSGEAFKVFTAFWKNALSRTEPAPPLAAPQHLEAPPNPLQSLPLEALALEAEIDWAKGFREVWRPGEAGAREELELFLNERAEVYLHERDRPGHTGTSRLSPHLHFGEIGPRQIWRAVKSHVLHRNTPGVMRNAEAYLRELGWREFAHHLLYHFPRTPEHPLRHEFQKFPWLSDALTLRAWQKGETGYPIVDAGMRELWTTGWMHNRVRMIAASFLVKDLMLPWQDGAKWFWETLVDADLANNTLGWQWTAGCGADAAPYFRIFNPLLQGKKFDEPGDYVRQWVPELAQLPNEWIHQPWAAPAEVLAKAGVELGKNYPRPIVEHGEARNRALAALKQITRPK